MPCLYQCPYAQLHIPCHIAGVTFLAFGNGAPDIFSSIAAYSSGVSVTGINTLLGGAIFVSNVVTGFVLIFGSIKKKESSFTRDLLALLSALVLLGCMTFTRVQSEYQLASLSFLLLYTLYVGAVIIRECRPSYTEGHSTVSDSKNIFVCEPDSSFWHSLKITSPESCEQESHFLLANPETKELKWSQAVTEIPFDGRCNVNINEQHFEDCSTLSHPLIIHDQGVSDVCRKNGAFVTQAKFSKGASLFEVAYWNHLRWRRRVKYRIVLRFTKSQSLWRTALSIPRYLLVLIQDITIPVIDEENWSRSFASFQVFIAPLFILYTTGLWSHQTFLSRILAWQLTLGIGIFFGAAVYFGTHRSRAPSSFAQSIMILALSFFSCVCWIYSLASEIMVLLIAIGKISGISSSLLGLTVLSWGNSIGDLITNISVARAGFSEMAVAGCFGGPVFNILVGLGLPLAIGIFKDGSVNNGLALDVQGEVSLLFLTATTLSSLLVFYFSPPSWLRHYGKVLLLYYFMYMMMTLMIACGYYIQA